MQLLKDIIGWGLIAILISEFLGLLILTVIDAVKTRAYKKQEKHDAEYELTEFEEHLDEHE